MKIRTLDIEELNHRLAELEGLRDAVTDAQDALKDASTDEEQESAQTDLDNAEAEFSKDEADELKALESLKDDIGERGGKINDEAGPFVHESDFEDHARELADDIGAIPSDANWPCNCIDWEKAADELKMDYSSVEWNGVTYLYRA